MKKSFALATEPHSAVIGDVELLFQPEVYGSEFLERYEELKQSQTGITDSDGEVDTARIRHITDMSRLFLARLMMPESAALFARWDVVVDGQNPRTYGDPNEAATAAEEHPGATVVNAGLRIPDRVLVELMEWATELYGGGSRPSTSSSDSATASPSPGTRGKAASPSRASTSTRGR